MNIFVNMITNIFAFTPNSILLLARFETVYQLLRIYRACTALAENIIYIYIYNTIYFFYFPGISFTCIISYWKYQHDT